MLIAWLTVHYPIKNGNGSSINREGGKPGTTHNKKRL